MHSVCCCSLPVWSLLKKGAPWPILASPWIRPWPKNNNTCKGPWVLHPYQVSSKSIKRFWRSRKCEKFTLDGRCTMIIAHSSLWLRWAKNPEPLIMVHMYAKFDDDAHNVPVYWVRNGVSICPSLLTSKILSSCFMCLPSLIKIHRGFSLSCS